LKLGNLHLFKVCNPWTTLSNKFFYKNVMIIQQEISYLNYLFLLPSCNPYTFNKKRIFWHPYFCLCFWFPLLRSHFGLYYASHNYSNYWSKRQSTSFITNLHGVVMYYKIYFWWGCVVIPNLNNLKIHFVKFAPTI
jgi:hypothetical protein